MTMEQLGNAIVNKKKTVRIAERFKFFKRDQLKEETFTIYLKELKKLATTCEFSEQLEEALCDRFVCGIQDESIQADLLTKHDLTLDDAYQYALTMEVVRYTDESKPFLKSHKEEDERSNCEGFENCHYSLEIKEEVQPFEQEEFEVQQEFVNLQSNPHLLIGTDCDDKFLQLNNHNGKKKFVCEYCHNVFSSNSHLTRHQRSHTGEKPFVCITCKKGFSRGESLHRHTQKSRGCADYEKQKTICKKNIKVDKIKVEHVCDICSHRFLKKAHLERHFRIHTGEKPYSCAVCNKGFTRKESLKQHLRIHGFEDHRLKKSLEKKALKCKTCGKIFLKKTDLEQHLKSHTETGKPNEQINLLDQVDIKTEVMDNSTIDSDKTQPLEKQVSLPKKIKKSFLCHICDYRTQKNSRLELHLKRHTGERPFPCDMCSYKAVCKSHLNIHKRVHSTEKLLICEFCGYKTNYSGILQTHRRIHTGEKPFKCRFCDYKCAERNSLKNHERIHTGEKPFSCNFCDYRAAQRTGLVYHLKTHKKEKASVTEQRAKTNN